MKSIGLVGGTFSNLIIAIELAETHQITLIELNAEIGLPSSSPGYIQNQNTLTNYLSQQQIDFLQIHSIDDGFGNHAHVCHSLNHGPENGCVGGL